MNEVIETVLETVTKATSEGKDAYVVAQGTNGMTYTGRVLGYRSSDEALVVMYEREREGKEFKTDLYISNLCSLQETTKEEIEKVRQEKRDRRGSRKDWR